MVVGGYGVQLYSFGVRGVVWSIMGRCRDCFELGSD